MDDNARDEDDVLWRKHVDRHRHDVSEKYTFKRHLEHANFGGVFGDRVRQNATISRDMNHRIGKIGELKSDKTTEQVTSLQ